MIVVFLINRMLARGIDYQTPFQMLSQFHSIPFALNLCPKFLVVYIMLIYILTKGISLILVLLNVYFLVTLIP